MNYFGVSDLAGSVGDFVKRTLTGEMSSADSPSPPPTMVESISKCAIRPSNLKTMNENYFADIDSTFSSVHSEAELELAIEKCKHMILESEERSDKRYNLIRKLIELRWRLQELQNGPQTPVVEESFTVMGHVFVSCRISDTDSYCEKCCTRIWDFVNVWPMQYFTCNKCLYKCHQKCMSSITRKCAYLKPHSYNLELCPESGLSAQNFKCNECRSALISPGLKLLPQLETARRLCDACGLWFCSYCHWNTEMIIPARVVHNWDFQPRKVCRSCVQFLRLMSKRPVLDLETLNPVLFSRVEELMTVKVLREDLLKMKQYLTRCHIAREKKLLWLLSKRHHFVENSTIYSLQDLEDLVSGSLLKYLRQVSTVFEEHITNDCEGCEGKGFYCELCLSNELIYPINRALTIRCEDCGSVFHRSCSQKHRGFCPRCERIAKRKLEKSTAGELEESKE